MLLILDLTTSDLPLLRIMYIIKTLLSIVSIAVPIILILMVSIDMVKMLINPNEKKPMKLIVNRLIMGALIFFIPMLVNFIMTLVGQAGVDKMKYWTQANKNTVESLNNQKEREVSQKREDNERKTYENKSNSLIKTANGLIEKDEKYVSNDDKQKLKSLISNLQNMINNKSSIDSIKKAYDDLKAHIILVKNNMPKEPEKKDINKYIFVGDSRTVMINDAVGSPENVNFVAKVGIGYSWFVSNAIPKVNEMISSDSDPHYIFFNLGVNDAVDGTSANRTLTNSYITMLVSLARNEWKNQRIVVISVMPTSDNTIYDHKDSAVVEFNSLVRSGIEGNDNLLYCDVYNGIGKSNFQYESDGLHYTNSMSKTIYEYILNNCKM